MSPFPKIGIGGTLERRSRLGERKKKKKITIFILLPRSDCVDTLLDIIQFRDSRHPVLSDSTTEQLTERTLQSADVITRDLGTTWNTPNTPLSNKTGS